MAPRGEVPVSPPGHRILVYGLLRRGQPGNSLLAGALFESICRLPGFEMVTEGPYPFAVHGEPGSSIVVEQYLVSEEVLSRLDRYEDYHGEGHPDNLYERIEVPTPSGMRAWIYVISGNSRKRLLGKLARIKSGDWLSYQG